MPREVALSGTQSTLSADGFRRSWHRPHVFVTIEVTGRALERAGHECAGECLQLVRVP